MGIPNPTSQERQYDEFTQLANILSPDPDYDAAKSIDRTSFDAILRLAQIGTGGVGSLATLSDVLLDNVQDGDLLAFSEASSKWINQTVIVLGGPF